MTEAEMKALAAHYRKLEETGEIYNRDVVIEYPSDALEDTGVYGISLDIGLVLRLYADHVAPERPGLAQELRYVADEYFYDRDLDDDDEDDEEMTAAQLAEHERCERLLERYREESQNEYMSADTLIRLELPYGINKEVGHLPIVFRAGDALKARADDCEELGMTVYAEQIRAVALKYFSGPKGTRRFVYNLYLDKEIWKDRLEIDIAVPHA